MPDYISKGKKAELEAEHKKLTTTTRKAVLEELEYAKSLGDLSENAEYHEARNKQRKLQERISSIEHILKNAVVTERTNAGRVEIGATVKVQKIGEKNEKIFSIVGAEEADMSSGKISHKSPLGEALFGAKVGDIVSVTSPNGEVEYKILDIK